MFKEERNESDKADEVDVSRIFDRADLLKRLMDDEELTKTIVTIFLNDMPRQITALRSFVENGHAGQAGVQAHQINEAAANVSALKFQETASDMEQAGKTGNLKALQTLLPKLEHRFSQVKIQMESNDT